jgi:hypothetical protein
MVKLPWTIKIHFKKVKDKEGKAGPFQGWVPEIGGGYQERVKEGGYGGCILYSCMKIE